MSVNSSQLSCSSRSSSVSSVATFDLFIDSNSSISLEESLMEEMPYDEEYPIPTIINNTNNGNITPPPWYDGYHQQNEMRPNPVRKTLRRDNRLEKSIFLPVVAVANLRSLVPKIRNFSKDVMERGIGVGLLTEVWQKTDNKKHIFEIEKMMKMEGIKYISTTRPSNKRGGGAAIVADMKKFSLEELNISIPYNLEIVWGMLRRNSNVSSKSVKKEIIVVSFYCPPRSTKKTKLLDHILTTVHMLLSKYPSAGIIIGGDKNDLNISALISGIPGVRQIVTKATHKSKILDIIITNLHQYYQVPIIVPPVQPDDPVRGVPSDHSVPLAIPVTTAHHTTREYKTVTVRPLPESGILEFKNWLSQVDWKHSLELPSPTRQVENFEKILESKLNLIFPLKTVKFSPTDKPFITAEIKKLDRKKKTEYRKHGKSVKYVALKNKFDLKYKKAAKKYIQKNSTDLKKENPSKAYSILKRMGAQPGDCGDDGTFSLQNHQDANMTLEECTEAIASHFSKISQEFSPLDPKNLPQRVQKKLLEPIKEEQLPKINESEVLDKIRKAKKPKSNIPGDIPKTLINECKNDLAKPVCKIFQTMVSTFQWPKQWRIEYGVPLKKVANPENEDQLRIISLTNFYSKVYESFVIDWLMEFIGHKIDWAQYGGQKGNSISHYLIELTNFVLYNQDLKNPRAILAMMVDFSKAYNRINHNKLIQILSDLDVPNWLLKIIMAFLSERELILRYKGVSSGKKSLPGGTPQGTRLGMLLFLVLINMTGFPDGELEKNVGEVITKPLNKRKPLEKAHMKYIDDLSFVQGLELKTCLRKRTEEQPRPLSYRCRTGHFLPESESALHDQVKKLNKYVQEYEMKINQSKSKVILFNTSRKFDFMPEISFDGKNNLEVVEEIKLLGIIFQSNMRWKSNTANLCRNGYARLWMLRNLKKYGAGRADLLDVYAKQVRCAVELAVPVWNAGITIAESNQLERVQKAAFHIILGASYISYSNALLELKMETLRDRR